MVPKLNTWKILIANICNVFHFEIWTTFTDVQMSYECQNGIVHLSVTWKGDLNANLPLNDNTLSCLMVDNVSEKIRIKYQLSNEKWINWSIFCYLHALTQKVIFLNSTIIKLCYEVIILVIISLFLILLCLFILQIWKDQHNILTAVVDTANYKYKTIFIAFMPSKHGSCAYKKITP